MKRPVTSPPNWGTPFKDGDALSIDKDGVFFIRCCDCGLVHVFQLLPKGRLHKLHAWRDNRRTAAVRAWMRRHNTWAHGTHLMLRALLGRRP